MPASPAIVRGNPPSNSVWLSACFAGDAVLLPAYFRGRRAALLHFHSHVIAMTRGGAAGAQAWLMRSGRRASTSGRTLSYSWRARRDRHRPIRHSAPGVPVPLDPGRSIFCAVLMALAAFIVLYGLAIYFRRNPQRHARYMIATLFPFVTPVTDRLIGRFFPSLIGLVPAIGGSPVVGVVGFLLADVALAALCLWDWKANRRADVFPVALAIVVLYPVLRHDLLPAAVLGRVRNWFVGLAPFMMPPHPLTDR